ncbi:MAG: carbohydrate ABC transporter permease [Candidatus Humimicrobiaceae bacterium]
MKNKIKITPSSIISKIGIYLGLIICFFFLLFPIYWIVTMALKPGVDILMYPPKFTFHPSIKSFLYILGIGKSAGIGNYFLQGMKNSIIIVTCSVIISLIIGLPAAYILARYNFKGKESLAFTILSFRFAPALLIILPVYLIFKKIGLYNNYIGLIWVYQLISLPMIIWIVRGYFEDIPYEIEQAGMLDGYSKISIFMKLVLPLAKGGIAAGTVLSFIYCWNNFIFGLILGSTDIQPLTVQALKYISADAVRYPEIAAVCIGASIPVLILSIFLQRYLVTGLSMGAIKR